MRRSRFLVSSLLAAGFTGHHDALAAGFVKATIGGSDGDGGSLLKRFSQEHMFTLASHSSHSSHSSHASHSSGYGGGGHYSHTSHRSSTGGGYSDDAPTYVSPYVAPAPAPAPSPTPTPAPYVAPQPLFGPDLRASAPPADAMPALSGRTRRFASIVRRVQIALLAQDLYSGAIDGAVGPALRSALRKFQKARGLEASGTITPQTLDALMVSSQ